MRVSLLIGVVALTPIVSGTASGQQVRDSAGARIVRYREGDRPAQTWRVEAKPLLVIGGAEGTGPTEFADVAGVARLANGNIFVAEAATNQLRLFDSKGTFVLRVGRMGMGPRTPAGVRPRRVAQTIGRPPSLSCGIAELSGGLSDAHDPAGRANSRNHGHPRPTPALRLMPFLSPLYGPSADTCSQPVASTLSSTGPVRTRYVAPALSTPSFPTRRSVQHDAPTGHNRNGDSSTSSSPTAA